MKKGKTKSLVWDEYKRVWHDYSSYLNKISIKEEVFPFHPLFAQSMSINKATMAVVDRRTMQYLYVADNVFDIMHFTKEQYMERGVELHFSNIQPNAQMGMLEFGRIISSYFKTLSNEQKEKYQCYWDYPIRKNDGTIIQILQRDRVMDYDDEGRINIVLLVCIDITNQKQNKSHHLRLTNGSENILYEYSLKEKALFKLEELSNRELEIAGMINKGLSRKQIADNLYLSFHTVNTHCKNINEKLRVNDSIELINLLKIFGFI
jgi:DNA-binding CsgD family transcriptional regulator